MNKIYVSYIICLKGKDGAESVELIECWIRESSRVNLHLIPLKDFILQIIQREKSNGHVISCEIQFSFVEQRKER